MGATIKSDSKEIIVTLASKSGDMFMEMAQKQRDGHEINQALLALLPEGAKYKSSLIETKKQKDYYLIRIYFEVA